MEFNQRTVLRIWGIAGGLALSLLIFVAGAVFNTPGIVKNACAEEGGQCDGKSEVEYNVLNRVSTGLCLYYNQSECSWVNGQTNRRVECPSGKFMMGHNQPKSVWPWNDPNQGYCCTLKLRQC